MSVWSGVIWSHLHSNPRLLRPFQPYNLEHTGEYWGKLGEFPVAPCACLTYFEWRTVISTSKLSYCRSGDFASLCEIFWVSDGRQSRGKKPRPLFKRTHFPQLFDSVQQNTQFHDQSGSCHSEWTDCTALSGIAVHASNSMMMMMIMMMVDDDADDGYSRYVKISAVRLFTVCF